MSRAERSHRQPPVRGERPLAALLLGVAFCTGVLSSLGAPLIPSVARTLHVSLDAAQWSLTVALLTSAVTAPILGRLGDGRHRRATIIGGLGVVFAGSFVAGFAESLPVLLVGRIMQGVGLGLVPPVMATARDHVQGERGRNLIRMLSVAGPASVGAGFPISGLIARDLGLHAAFLFGAVISGVALVAALLIIPSSHDTHGPPLDRVGSGLLTVTLTVLIVGIGQGTRWGWSSAPVLALFALAAIGAVVWTRQQITAAAPLVDLRQLRHRGVLTADIATLGLGTSMYIDITVVTEFIQEPRALGYGLGATALTAGLCLLPFSVLSPPSARLNELVQRRVSEMTILVFGCVWIAGTGVFFAVEHGALWEAFVTMGLLGCGFGFSFAAIPGIITGAVPGPETGSAMGFYQVIRYVGFALGSALSASIVAASTSGGRVAESGYVTALWVGVGIASLAAAVALVLSRRALGRVPVQVTAPR